MGDTLTVDRWQQYRQAAQAWQQWQTGTPVKLAPVKTDNGKGSK